MKDKHKKLAAVTGASSGIGKAVALELAKRGYDLIVIARRKNLLNELKREIQAKGKTRVKTITSDLGRVDALPELVKDLSHHKIDLFINNAGAGYRGTVLNQDPARLASILQVLVVALTYLTSAVGAQMAKRGGGTVVNVASGLAYTSVLPNSAVYAASKRYVWDFTRAVNYENLSLKNNVRAVSVQPGVIVSEFGQTSQPDPSQPADSHYLKRTPTDEFAKAMVDGIERGETDFYYGELAAELKEMGETKKPAEYVKKMAELVQRGNKED